MFKKKILKYFGFFFLLFLIISIFFTDIYFNLFKEPFQKILASKLKVKTIDYDNVDGNIINGFKFENVKIYSNEYEFISNELYIKTDLKHLFKGLEELDLIESKGVKLKIKSSIEDFFNKPSNSSEALFVKKVYLSDFMVSYNNQNIFFEDLNISFYPLEGYLVDGKGRLNFLNSNFILERIKVKSLDKYHIDAELFFQGQRYIIKSELAFKEVSKNIKLEINNSLYDISLIPEEKFYLGAFSINNGILQDFNLEGYSGRYDFSSNLLFLEASNSVNLINFSYDFKNEIYESLIKVNDSSSEDYTFNTLELSIKGDFHKKFEGYFNLEEVEIFDRNFSNIFGKIEYSDNRLLIAVPKNRNEVEVSGKYAISGHLTIQDSLLNVKNIELSIEDEESFFLENQRLSIGNEGLYGKNILLKYKKGEALIRDFSFISLNQFFFKISFEKFNIYLFKGLNADGYLSGNLYILYDEDDYSARFNDITIEKFSYENYDFDSVDIEGSLDNDSIDLSALKVYKQIGLLDLSGSFSSINDFYNGNINNLKIKFN